MKAQMKAVMASAVVIVLALAAVSGVTYSWFSDSDNADVIIQTAKVDIDLSFEENSATKEYDLPDSWDGRELKIDYWITNKSTIDTIYRSVITVTASGIVDGSILNSALKLNKTNILQFTESTATDGSYIATTPLGWSELDKPDNEVEGDKTKGTIFIDHISVGDLDGATITITLAVEAYPSEYIPDIEADSDGENYKAELKGDAVTTNGVTVNTPMATITFDEDAVENLGDTIVTITPKDVDDVTQEGIEISSGTNFLQAFEVTFENGATMGDGAARVSVTVDGIIDNLIIRHYEDGTSVDDVDIVEILHVGNTTVITFIANSFSTYMVLEAVPQTVNTLDALINAIENYPLVTLGGNIDVTFDYTEGGAAITPLVIDGKSVTLNLNGYSLYSTSSPTTNGNYSLLNVTGGADLTITGPGIIKLTHEGVNMAYNNYSSVVTVARSSFTVTEDVVIEHTGGTDMAYAIDVLTSGANTYATLVVDDTTLTSTYTALRTFCNGGKVDLNIADSTLSAEKRGIFVHMTNNSEFEGEIDGCSIDGKDYAILVNPFGGNGKEFEVRLDLGSNMTLTSENADRSTVTFWNEIDGSNLNVELTVGGVETTDLSTIATNENGNKFAVLENPGSIVMNGLSIWDGETIKGLVKDEGSNTYTISNAAQLVGFAKAVNEDGNAFAGMTVKMLVDVDLNDHEWTPIGQTGSTTFNGVFDGNGHVIYNLNVDSSDETGAHHSSGLFGWVESHTEGCGQLINVQIIGATIVGHHNTGALVGYITEETALVENCHVKNATISCTHANSDADGDKAGALVGNLTNATSMKDCTAEDCSVSAGRDAGQIAGAGNMNNISGCTAINVTVESNNTSTGNNIGNSIVGRVLS